MNQITTYDLTGRQLQIVKHTVASDCTPEEFDLYMEAARSYGLDPFRRQIIPLVFGKNDRDQSKRRMSIVISRDGLRVVAQRCGDYRPASEKSDFELDESLISAINPKGLVSCTIYLWKQDKKGDWYPVKGEAYWDEFAPLSYPQDAYRYEETGEVWEDSGKPKKRRVLKEDAQVTLDDRGNWAKMPRLMLEKCAEAQALRAGWPDQFGGLYVEEEMEKTRVADLSATEIVAQEQENQRMALAGAQDSLVITWGDGWALEHVPYGEFMDRAIAFVNESDPLTVNKWEQANRVSLKTFWARHPGDAHELKQKIEAKVEEGKRKPATVAG